MRPRQLTMQAFGPYEKKTFIDFDALTENSQLFLITGDTGAGKTMIFDAISYALFGSDSGKIRDSQDLRTSSADGRTSTEVELRFEHAGNVYVVTRGERHWNKKSDKELTNPDSYVELKYDDGSVIADKTNTVKNKVADILGMDQAQFEQVTMIAQGKFRELLSANSEDRKRLLTQLFRTEKFGQLMDRLKKEKSSAKEIFDRISGEIDHVGSDIVLEPDMNMEEHAELWNYTDARSLETAVDSLSKLVDGQRQHSHDLNCEVKTLDTEIGKLQSKAGELNRLAKIQDILTQKNAELPALNTRKMAADSQWEEARKNKTGIDELRNQISVKTSHLDDYNVLDSRNQALTQNREQKTKLIAEITQLDKQITEKQTSLQKEEEEWNLGKNARSEQAELEKERAKLREEYKDYRHLQKEIQKMDEKYEALNDKKGILAEAQKVLSDAEKESKKQQDVFSDLQKQYYDNQAGILASQLEDGDPCPVCGSLHHPELAQLPLEAPSKEKLDAAEKERARLEQEASKASGAVERAQGIKDSASKSFREQKKRTLQEARSLFGDGEQLAFDMEQWRNILEKKIGTEEDQKNNDSNEDSNEKPELIAKGKELNARLELLKKTITRLGQLEKEIPALRQTVQNLQTDRNQKAQELSGLAGEEARLQEEVKTTRENLLRANLDKQSRKEAEEEIAQLKKSLDDLQSALDTAEKEHNEAVQALRAAQNEIAAYQKQLDGFKPEQQKELNEELDEKQKEKETLYKEATDLQGRLSRNQRAQKRLLVLKDQYIAAEKKFSQLEELDKAASATSAGGQDGSGRVTFDIFVLQAYFDEVLSRANQRLRTMSGKRYTLHRRKQAKNKQAKTGLDIDVHDSFTASDRHAETLSGGESFLASMALALGFSDVVQEHAGGVRIESLFIDEGFGTLDEDSLNKAVMTLQDLAGSDRMVAVISHVAELQEKIENQLVVEKNPGKSSTVRLVTPTTGI